VIAHDGRPLAGELRAGGGVELREIEDFNGHEPDPEPAPSWAQAWPRPVDA
jgi:hypothetical protein